MIVWLNLRSGSQACCHTVRSGLRSWIHGCFEHGAPIREPATLVCFLDPGIQLNSNMAFLDNWVGYVPTRLLSLGFTSIFPEHSGRCDESLKARPGTRHLCRKTGGIRSPMQQNVKKNTHEASMRVVVSPQHGRTQPAIIRR